MARKHRQAVCATIPDSYLKNLELKSIQQYIKGGDRLLDVGCGNGYTCYWIREHIDVSVKGIDFSEEMIRVAQSMLSSQEKIEFQVESVTDLSSPDECFDVVLSERCLINLCSWEEQMRAMDQICRVLKKGGLFIMAEAFSEPLDNLNELRCLVGLPSIRQKWHNIYINEQSLLLFAEKNFYLKSIDNYSSLYYILTRVVSPKIGEMEKKHTGYQDPINYVASLLPSTGNYGPQKTIVLEKK
ncbi:MAG: hypothetical protein BWK76_14545 [Desulfobulbaceae bacterium A2]|nr:MAG: hypothetical protein BWK76_14545 [Desulfobulbaceae bacterium A2]